MVSAAEWGGVAPSPQDPAGRPQSRIHTLTVHHQGEFWVAGADVPAYLRRLQQWSRRAKSWVDVPYHYIIAPDGAIYQGRPPGLAGDSNTDYDTQGHLQVMLLGNFEIQQPSQAQWNSAVRLLSHLMLAHGLRPQDLAAHRHHTGQTVCPGANLLERFEELRRSLPQP